MPACITHHYFAKNVLASLKDKNEINECAFLWGAQGPDFFFCQSFLPWRKDKTISAYGNRLHEALPSHTLNAMREFTQIHSDATTLSYVLGFICHYSLDCTAHPYINFLSAQLAAERENETASTMHSEVEAALDTITLRSETGKLPSEISLGKMFPKNEAVQRKIAALYSYVISKVFGEAAAEEQIFTAAKDAHFLFTLLTDRTGFKKKLVAAAESGKPHSISSHFVPITERDDVDYANLQQSVWQANGEETDKSFFTLAEEAQSLAVDLIENFATEDFSKATGEKPFG